MGTTAEVYDAKMAGLAHEVAKAVHYAIDSLSIHPILIFADNSSAIMTIYDQKLVAACQGYAQLKNSSNLTNKTQLKLPGKLWAPTQNDEPKPKLWRTGGRNMHADPSEADLHWQIVYLHAGNPETTSITPQEKSMDDSYNVEHDMPSLVNTTPNLYQQNQFSTPAALVHKLKTTLSKHVKSTTTIETSYGIYQIGEILGIKEGIEALAEFIEKSGAFKKAGVTKGWQRSD
ncbi:hypothetical protein F5876DRAFT_81487 [Lentinula aff. lateritia]|uniref:Uncharacterized protein n=1 Tax=Lentinula aff. lateritia TaxID=2804960 RepID=A0ACC1TLV5_9AGAR|nr:hypothetical protein F5876DRAFT_81487 [Lentinula aff. lateritia]